MSLAGMNILITRPAAQSAGLASLVSKAGGHPVIFPLLTIDAVTDPRSLLVLERRIKQLDRFQFAIFVSSNAARLAVPLIRKYWDFLPADLTLLAIGPSTARELASLQKEVVTAEGGVQSEDLLQLPLLRQLAGKNVLIFRGSGGRELLAETLRERGAVVDYLELYRRGTPPIAPGQLARLLQAESVNTIVITSSQALQSLCDALGPLSDSNNTNLGLIPLLVPSERVAGQALAAGFSNIININSADDQGMLAGLRSIASHLFPAQHATQDGVDSK